MWKLITYILFFAISTIILVIYLQTPSHNRNWETGFDVMPRVTVNENLVTIENLRDWEYTKSEVVSFDYNNETYDIDKLTQAYFLIEPFSKWDGIAHTYLAFDFEDKEPIAFSVEARREKGEKYYALLGLFNKYELMYIWGTEEDLDAQRTVKQGNELYKYPLKIEKERAKNLFKQLAIETQSLEQNAKFYNTINSNCTNLLADFANKAGNQNQKSIPWHYSRILPGFADEYLDKLGYIEKN